MPRNLRKMLAPIDLSAPGGVEALLEFHRARFGDAVMELGADGGEGAESDGEQPPAGGEDRGFPANTPVVEMTPEQQVAYWRTQARKHEDRVKERSDYDDLKAKAEELEQLRAASMTEQEKALAEAVEKARTEARAEAVRELGATTVTTLFKSALEGRGKTAEQVEVLMKHFNAESFIVDGQADTKTILSLADSIAGPVTGGGKGSGPDFGQGNRGQHGKASGVNAGAEMFAASRSGK